MKSTALKNEYEGVLRSVDSLLKSRGFKRRGQVFRLFSDGNCGIVEFQKSDKSSEDRLMFTINLGVVSGELLGADPATEKSLGSIDAHLRQRVGMLMPDRPDKWWVLESSTNAEALADELTNLLSERAVPFIQEYLSTDSLIALWEAGQSPGLTAVQRDRYLSALKRSQRGG